MLLCFRKLNLHCFVRLGLITIGRVAYFALPKTYPASPTPKIENMSIDSRSSTTKNLYKDFIALCEGERERERKRGKERGREREREREAVREMSVKRGSSYFSYRIKKMKKNQPPQKTDKTDTSPSPSSLSSSTSASSASLSSSSSVSFDARMVRAIFRKLQQRSGLFFPPDGDSFGLRGCQIFRNKNVRQFCE